MTTSWVSQMQQAIIQVTQAHPQIPVAVARAPQIRLDRFRGGDYSRLGTIRIPTEIAFFLGPLSWKWENFV